MHKNHFWSASKTHNFKSFFFVFQCRLESFYLPTKKKDHNSKNSHFISSNNLLCDLFSVNSWEMLKVRCFNKDWWNINYEWLNSTPPPPFPFHHSTPISNHLLFTLISPFFLSPFNIMESGALLLTMIVQSSVAKLSPSEK